jgi:hypothetical protein
VHEFGIGTKQVYNYEQTDEYRLGKRHGEIFITNWAVDQTDISGIIEDINEHVKNTWSIACVEKYDYKVTIRFMKKKDANWFEASEWNNDFERKILL